MIRPLTKVSQEGEVYSRPEGVEENVAGALGLGIEAIRARLKAGSDSDEYLASECLVFLFREARANNDDNMCDLIARAILNRCENILRRRVSPQLLDDILGEFAVLLANDADEELDYFECRFNNAFRTYRLSRVRTDARRRERVETRAFGSTASDDDEDTIQGNEPECRATEAEDLERCELLDQLPDDVRKAVILREMGYPIESEDPSEESVATLCRVSGRTIHNWLNRAKAILANTSKESAR